MKMDLVLNNLQCLICHKTQPNQTLCPIIIGTLTDKFQTLNVTAMGQIVIYDM